MEVPFDGTPTLFQEIQTLDDSVYVKHALNRIPFVEDMLPI
jgi:hypothetical protein